MPMDQDVAAMLNAAQARGALAAANHQDGAMARQTDFAAQDHRQVTALLARQLAMASDAETDADLSAALATPHAPSAAPGAPAGASPAKTA